MPQELHVLRCASCETFQVDIVKKIPKWSCKICGEKQSVQKVYGTGTGQECRFLVQSLNEQRLTAPNCDVPVLEVKDEGFVVEDVKPSNVGAAKTSKWAKFVEPEASVTSRSEISNEANKGKWETFVNNHKTESEVCNDSHKQSENVTKVAASQSDNMFEDTNEIDDFLVL